MDFGLMYQGRRYNRTVDLYDHGVGSYDPREGRVLKADPMAFAAARNAYEPGEVSHNGFWYSVAGFTRGAPDDGRYGWGGRHLSASRLHHARGWPGV